MPKKSNTTRKCIGCDNIIPYMKYKTRCVDCYKKHKFDETTKEMLKNNFSLFINDDD